MQCVDYLGIDTGVVPLSTSIAPGHNTLQLAVAHNGATRVTLRTESVMSSTSHRGGHYILLSWLEYLVTYLARVLASLEVSGAEHGIGDHARVGVLAVAVGQDGEIQALKLVTISSWRWRERKMVVKPQ